MLVSSSLTAARPLPAFTGFSYIASLVIRYSVLPHKAITTQNIVITARVCNKYFSILLYNYSFIISRKRGIYESFIKFNRKMQS